MYCKYCGKIVDDNSAFCVHCGNNVNGRGNEPGCEDQPSKGYAILGFFVPLVGLILYLYYERKLPNKAKSAGKGALAGVITRIVIYIAVAIASFVFAFHMGNSIKMPEGFDVESGTFKIDDNGYMQDTFIDVITEKSKASISQKILWSKVYHRDCNVLTYKDNLHLF